MARQLDTRLELVEPHIKYNYVSKYSNVRWNSKLHFLYDLIGKDVLKSSSKATVVQATTIFEQAEKVTNTVQSNTTTVKEAVAALDDLKEV